MADRAGIVPGSVGRHGPSRLPLMRILVAVDTPWLIETVAIRLLTTDLGFHMTEEAGHRLVTPPEREAALLVTPDRKVRRQEPEHRMTVRAGRIGGRRQLPDMDIQMTVVTGPEREPSRAPRCRVAGLTTDLGVPSCQGVAGRLVIEVPRLDPGPRGRLVTALASLAQAPFMIVLVTIHAAVGADRHIAHELAFTGVAGLTRNLRMPAGQGEIGEAVVESRSRLPLLFHVARPTVRPQLTDMHILVAADAGRKPRHLEDPHCLILVRRVTGRAGRIRVLAHQRESCLPMVETGCRRPGIGLMARGAVIAQPVPVSIRMTAHTCPPKTQIGPPQVFARRGQDLGFGNVLCCMTRATPTLGMGTIQRESGQLVVETLLARLAPENHLEVTALVIHMTVLTAPIPGLGMQTRTRLDPCCQHRVTGETLLIECPAPDRVAGRAAPQPFE